MLVARFVIFSVAISLNECNYFPKLYYQNKNLQECIKYVIKTYFHQYKELTYVDMNRDSPEIIKNININSFVAIVTRSANIRMNISDLSFLITASNAEDFLNNFEELAREALWNPNTRFLILIQNIKETDIRNVFDMLLKFHIVNVVVMDEAFDPKVYTYNPFDNYRCGTYYENVTELGKCSNIKTIINLYPYKYVTGLRNCTFRVTSPHWPPYTINERKYKRTHLLGIEEYILKEISILEKFDLKFFYSDDGDIYTVINNDMSADGPLLLLQNGATDIIAGGMVLTESRAMAFNYIFNHLAFTDDIRYLVKRATIVSSWKNVYLEFSSIVWVALFFAFTVYFSVFILLVRPKDKGKILLKMIAYMVLSGSEIKGDGVTKYLFITWVWFAYLVNTYYQSILMSLTSNPSFNYQISSERDIVRYNLKPCVSDGVSRYLESAKNITLEDNQQKGCNSMLESIHTVSQSNDLFTLTINTIYTYNEYSFYDDTGDSMIFAFKQPLSKIIYAMYLYKGFPMLDKISLNVLRLRENGLIDYYLQSLFLENIEKYRFFEIKKSVRIDIAWYVLVCGYSLSLGILMIEILIKRYLVVCNRISK